MEREGAICYKCRWVELPCEQCGTMRRRSVATLARIQGRMTNLGTYTGRVFCNQHCFARWVGLQNGPGGSEPKTGG